MTLICNNEVLVIYRDLALLIKCEFNVFYLFENVSDVHLQVE